ncbi:HD-GYP domain-containing protein [Palleronia sp. LCG004]|uniref:HD-GYP domain-containing protein n=1 Tax=Palleronia sp. LCG004 TaxID=3079304 RepID=UPI002943E43E|nr:HD domain-containing phosphohydrolase [Palleronia sp. LCG004]WOI57781.1 HD domain-containing phosphohydrolase [Palleronia sp. LCG004]
MKHFADFRPHDRWPDGLGTLRLSELLGSLSHALDATEGQPAGHAIRVTAIGDEIGCRLGLPVEERHDLYYTLLLKDLGCSSNAARICELYLADDMEFKQAFKLIDGTTRSALHFLLRETARGNSTIRRAKTLISVIRNAGPIVDELIETRCQQGSSIACTMGFSDRVARGIHALDEHWDGSGRPEHLSGEEIPLGARIALVAQVADVFMQSGGIDNAIDEISSRSGTWFDPAVARVAVAVLKDPSLRARLAAPDLARAVFSNPAVIGAADLTDDKMDRIIAGFSKVIDAKSPFTNNHSQRVAGYVDRVTATLGYDGHCRAWMRRSALLHDIGKLGVPNRILDKPGKLDTGERRVIESHTLIGRKILGKIGVFARSAHLAEAHHERLDGMGYPYRLGANDLTLDVRVLTVTDIYDALSAERPYKPALPRERVHEIMSGMVGTSIDGMCYDALTSAIAGD